MTLKQFMIMALVSSILGSCGGNASKTSNKNNPFLKSYETPFDVPAFDKIESTFFMPAFEEGMKQQKENINSIIENKEKPSFANTIETFEQSGKLLNRVSTVFFNLSSANTNKEIEDINKIISPILSSHNDDIYMNANLFEKVKSVYDNKNNLKLNIEEEQLLTKTYKSFVRNGINLSNEAQNRLREINKELSSLTVKFGKNLLDENNNFELIIENENDLKGLPASIIEMAANRSKDKGEDNKWIFTLHNPSALPFLQYADNRELRKAMYEAYIEKCNHNDELDNKETASVIASLRAERAQLLGYKNHASYILEEAMAKTPEKVNELLSQLWEPSIKVVKQEAMEIQQMMEKTAKGEKLEAWDWSYYAEKVRKEKYDFDTEEVRPYFKLENVREGIFTLCDKLYGLKFTENNDIPRYNPDVIAFEVKESDGTHLGILYMDFFSRSSKRSGAWMTSYRKAYRENGKRVAPIISIVCNFSRQSNSEEPVLLTADEVETFFHEFGHALHGLMGNTKYYNLSGTSVPRDFVELPSQILENWAFEPEMLELYARHYETGEIIPAELVKKMEDASKFNQGFATVEYLAASILDMGYHTIENSSAIDAYLFEKELMTNIGLLSQIAPRYRTTYFQHIFAGGYSSGYYSYIWSEVLDSDAFQAFKESGDIFNREIANSFRKNILEKGGTEDPMTMYKAFRGKEPEIKHLVERRGLN